LNFTTALPGRKRRSVAVKAAEALGYEVESFEGD
jgi:hypothetical protein